jgi:hypothetical protein
VFSRGPGSSGGPTGRSFIRGPQGGGSGLGGSGGFDQRRLRGPGSGGFGPRF